MPLPLPLVPFERYILADDRPAYPMNFQIRLQLIGQVQPGAMQAAFSGAASRHPLLAACVAGKGKSLCWVPAEMPELDWLPAPPPLGCPPARPLDLRQEPGLKGWAWQDGDQSELVLQIHHAVADGLGGFRFVEDLLVCYDAALKGKMPFTTLEPLDPKLLVRRAQPRISRLDFFKTLPVQLDGLARGRDFLLHRALPLTPASVAHALDEPSQPFPAVIYGVLSADEATAHWEAARRLGVTPNDLFARDLFLSLASWRSQRYPGRTRGWYRLSVPVSLRREEDERMPAANMVGMVLLDRREREMSSPAALLRGIHAEMQRVKRHDLAVAFLFSLQVLAAIPGMLARVTRPSRCAATALFTNLGDPLERTPLSSTSTGHLSAGNAVLRSLYAPAPVRPYTSAALSIVRYAGQLFFALTYDPRAISPDDAESLWQEFFQRVHDSGRLAGSAHLGSIA